MSEYEAKREVGLKVRLGKYTIRLHRSGYVISDGMTGRGFPYPWRASFWLWVRLRLRCYLMGHSFETSTVDATQGICPPLYSCKDCGHIGRGLHDH